jgi:hypothetical protein
VEEVAVAGSLYMITFFKHSPEIQRKGCIYVVDIEGFKGVLVINSMFLFEKTYNFFKWMLPQQVKNLVRA